MVTQKEVGQAIIRFRKLHGLSQERFALESGIDRRYLSDVENGKRNVSFDLLNRVASYFKVSLGHFLEEAEQSFTFFSIDDLKLFLKERGYEKTSFFANPDFLDAIVGISEEGHLVYSYSKMVESLVLRESFKYETAVEFINYNTINTIPNMGEYAPIILLSISD